MSLKNSSVAIYRQIIEYFELEIASGRLKAGDRIESIRALALFFKVNPNTVQKALNETRARWFN
ncbi:GntR family transcriptional regulator [Erysipelothrix sp. Poltava]|nr:GntR family transcriptional regulator [Erysipelothrix sp. Poltava]